MKEPQSGNLCFPPSTLRRDHKGWSAEQWKQVMFSNDSSFSLFPTTGRLYVWRQLREVYIPDCFLPTVKHGGWSVMVWAATSWNSLDLIISLHGGINSKDYLNILEDHVHPMVQALFPDGDDIFQNYNSPINTAHLAKNWYKEYDSGIENVEWPPQYPDLNILSICDASWSDKLETITLCCRVWKS